MWQANIHYKMCWFSNRRKIWIFFPNMCPFKLTFLTLSLNYVQEHLWIVYKNTRLHSGYASPSQSTPRHRCYDTAAGTAGLHPPLITSSSFDCIRCLFQKHSQCREESEFYFEWLLVKKWMLVAVMFCSVSRGLYISEKCQLVLTRKGRDIRNEDCGYGNCFASWLVFIQSNLKTPICVVSASGEASDTIKAIGGNWEEDRNQWQPLPFPEHKWWAWTSLARVRVQDN